MFDRQWFVWIVRHCIVVKVILVSFLVQFFYAWEKKTEDTARYVNERLIINYRHLLSLAVIDIWWLSEKRDDDDDHRQEREEISQEKNNKYLARHTTISTPLGHARAHDPKIEAQENPQRKYFYGEKISKIYDLSLVKIVFSRLIMRDILLISSILHLSSWFLVKLFVFVKLVALFFLSSMTSIGTTAAGEFPGGKSINPAGLNLSFACCLLQHPQWDFFFDKRPPPGC